MAADIFFNQDHDEGETRNELTMEYFFLFRLSLNK